MSNRNINPIAPAIIPFDFEGTEVRVIDRDGEPWWLHAEVCAVLEIANTGNASARLDEDEKATIQIADSGNLNADRTIINESGLWSLVLTSRKPAAKRFKKWITSEVIPSIRKTGGYIASNGHLNAQQTGGIVKAGLGKLKRELLAELTPQFAALAEELRSTHRPVGVAVVTHRTAKRWLDHYHITKRPKGLALRVSNALTRQSIRMGYAVSYTAEEEKRSFHEVVANAYFSTGEGRYLLPKAVKGQKEMGLEAAPVPFSQTPA